MTRPNARGIYITGPAGKIETVITDPGDKRRGIAVIAHPHSLFGGSMDNKVVQILARAFTESDYVAARFNFRGVGNSSGVFDGGIGETDDLLSVVTTMKQEFDSLPLVLAGFSFGGYVQARASQHFPSARLVLIAPAVSRFKVPAVPKGTLVVHGENDDIVPLKDVLDWARPHETPILVIPGAEHFFHGRLHQLKDIILQAFM